MPVGHGRKGPKLRLQLPSFSGLTAKQPNMLHYTCQLDCRLRTVKPLRVSSPHDSSSDATAQGRDQTDVLVEMIGRRPVLTIAFDDMEMTVEQPRMLPEALSQENKWEIGAKSPSLLAAAA